MMSRALRFAVVTSSAACLLGACGVDAFRPTFPDSSPSELRAISARIASAPLVVEPSVAVALTDEPYRLVAYDMATGRVSWEQPVQAPRSAPIVAGDLVVLHEGDHVVARRVSDGTRAFDLDDARLALVGAAGEGPLVAIVLSTTGGGVGAQSRVFIVQRGGLAGFTDADVSAGWPAVRGELVFVPWDNQNVSVIEGGSEVARIRSMAGIVSHAVAADGALFFGQAGIGRLSGELDPDDPGSIGWVQPASDQLPGEPPLWRSAYEPPAGPRSAVHRVRLVWAPAGGTGPVRFSDDTLYLTFYRLVFALSPDDLSVRWVRSLDADVVGASARAGGVVVADASGGLILLGSADGLARWRAQMGVEPTVVALRLGALTVGSPDGAAPPLGDQLLSAAQNTDARLVPARAFAVRQLASLPDESITRSLLVLCDDTSIPDPVREASCGALAVRESGLDAVLEGLQRHAAFLEGTSAPPVGPLAAVAARLGDPRAVPLLVAHLGDPNTPAADLPALAGALAALGDQSAAEPLEDFLWLYHAEAADEDLARGLASVAEALIELTGPPGREEVQAILDAPFTSPTARALIAAVLERRREGSEAQSSEGSAGD